MGWHQPVKELKSVGKIFIECPYDFASEVIYTVNLRKFELVKKKCATPEILPQIRLCSGPPMGDLCEKSDFSL